MLYHKIGTNNFNISEIALESWQIDRKWSSTVYDKTADELINTAIDKNVNFTLFSLKLY